MTKNTHTHNNSHKNPASAHLDDARVLLICVRHDLHELRAEERGAGELVGEHKGKRLLKAHVHEERGVEERRERGLSIL